MRITDKDTADDVKYHLMRENPPEPLRARDCTDFFKLADGRLCKFNEGHLHCLCENMVKYGECPKKIRE